VPNAVSPTALEAQLATWREQYGELYCTEFEGSEGVMFIWRPLNEMEFHEIANASYGNEIKEEAICMVCVLYPVSFDYHNCAMAGYATVLARQILQASYYDSADRALALLDAYRHEMVVDFGAQLDCIVAEAFPQYPVETIRHMHMKRRLWLLSRAEWTLINLRGVPLVHTVGNTARGPGAQYAQLNNDMSPFHAEQPSIPGLEEAVETVFRDEHYRGSDPAWIFDDDDDDCDILGS